MIFSEKFSFFFFLFFPLSLIPLSSAFGQTTGVLPGLGGVKLLDLSLVAESSLGLSSAPMEGIPFLQGGDHDPKGNGFTFRGAELSLMGAVDPYLFGAIHLLFRHDRWSSDSSVEVEEGYSRTIFIPDIEIKGGLFLTEYGLLNFLHPHSWFFLDQPIVLSWLLGPDGWREVGGRIKWILPLPFYSALFSGVHNPQGISFFSFSPNPLEHDHGKEEDSSHTTQPNGDSHPPEPPSKRNYPRTPREMVYTLRWEGGETFSSHSVLFQTSLALGPNPYEKGRTILSSLGGKYRYRPLSHYKGFPFVHILIEGNQREISARSTHEQNGEEVEKGNDLGGLVEIVWGIFYPWALGVRGERAYSKNPFMEDLFRMGRSRFSTLLLLQPTEFSRLRLQYNLDLTRVVEKGRAHSLYLDVEFLFGSHPAHLF